MAELLLENKETVGLNSWSCHQKYMHNLAAKHSFLKQVSLHLVVFYVCAIHWENPSWLIHFFPKQPHQVAA